MGARQIGCLGGIVVALALGLGVAAAIPTLPTEQNQEVATWFVRVFAFVMVTWLVGMGINKILATLVPTPAEIAKREADRAIKDAPLRTTGDAAPGNYLRVRGRIESIDGKTIEAPVTGRACVLYVLTREGHTYGGPNHRRGGGTKTREQGVRAHLADAATGIAIALDGQEWSPTGDATGDAFMERAAEAMRSLGDDPRLYPEVQFQGDPVRIESSGTEPRNWPPGADPPSVERIRAIDEHAFPRAAHHDATYGERVILQGQEVEAVGLVVSIDGRLVLTGPPNGKLQIVVR